MRYEKFMTDRAALDYVSGRLRALEESGGAGHIVWSLGLGSEALADALSSPAVRAVLEAEGQTARQFVILMGGPSTGKGFLVWAKFGEQFGLVDGKPVKDWLDIDHLNPEEVQEGDAILREIQRGVAIIAFNRLYNAAVGGGRRAFDAAVEEVYYTTKDGSKVQLADHMTYHEFLACLSQGQDLGADTAKLAAHVRQVKTDLAKETDKTKKKHLAADLAATRAELIDALEQMDMATAESALPTFEGFISEAAGTKRLRSILNQAREAKPKSQDAFDEFYDITKAQFWKSMRGWRDDGARGVERFKEVSRREFEKDIKEQPGVRALLGGNIIVVDSPGEDVEKQHYVGQCAEAERAGFVTNIINLDPRLAGDAVLLMRLSNLTRNVDEDDRMVDDKDIVGYWDGVEPAIERIREGAFPRGPVHRYFHLVKDVENVGFMVQVASAIEGAMHGKDEPTTPAKLAHEGVTAEEAAAVLHKYKIDINLATKIKKRSQLKKWWNETVRRVIFGIDPHEPYKIERDQSFGVDLRSADALAGAAKRLAGAPEYGSAAEDDYKNMVRSVGQWDREYQEWTDRDVWDAFSDKALDVKESNNNTDMEINEHLTRLIAEGKRSGKVLSFDDFVTESRVDEDGYGEQAFFATKSGDVNNYFFKIESSNGGHRSLVLTVGKFCRFAEPAEAKTSYAVLSVTELSEAQLDQAVVDDGQFEPNDRPVELTEHEAVRFCETVALCIADYLQKNPKVMKFYDEVESAVEGPYQSQLSVALAKWPGGADAWHVQELEPGKLIMITK